MAYLKNYTLLFDEEETSKLKTRVFSIYRSEEMEDDNWIISGLYIRNSDFHNHPPEKISLRLEWK